MRNITQQSTHFITQPPLTSTAHRTRACDVRTCFSAGGYFAAVFTAADARVVHESIQVGLEDAMRIGPSDFLQERRIVLVLGIVVVVRRTVQRERHLAEGDPADHAALRVVHASSRVRIEPLSCRRFSAEMKGAGHIYLSCRWTKDDALFSLRVLCAVCCVLCVVYFCTEKQNCMCVYHAVIYNKAKWLVLILTQSLSRT